MKNLDWILLLFLVLVTSSQSFAQDKYNSFGASITASDAQSVNELASLVTMNDSIPIKLTGKIAEVCQSKGCWMKLENNTGEEIRVTFRDYGFFVPKDAAGELTIVEGYVSKIKLSEEEARHYAEDAGEAYDPSRAYVEYAVVADGVLITTTQE